MKRLLDGGPLEGSAAVACVAITVVAAAGAFPEGRIADRVAAFAEFVAAAAFIAWMLRARANIAALVDAAFLPPWLVAAGWFIPLASLVLPLRAMREIVEASKAAASSTSYATTNSPWWVGFWWVAFCVASLVDAIAGRAVLVVDGVAAACAVYVVVRVTVWQRAALQQQRDRLAAVPSVPAVPVA